MWVPPIIFSVCLSILAGLTTLWKVSKKFISNTPYLNPSELALVLGNFESKIFRQGANVTEAFKLSVTVN